MASSDVPRLNSIRILSFLHRVISNRLEQEQLMSDRVWCVITVVALFEGIAFNFDPTLGWELVLTLFVAAVQEYLTDRHEL